MSRLIYLFADRGIAPGKQTGAMAHFHAVVRTLAGLGHEVLVMSSVEPPVDAAVTFEPIPSPAFVRRLVSDTEGEGTGGRAGQAERRVALAVAHLLHNAAVEEMLVRIAPRFGPDAVLERYVPFGFAGVYASAALGLRHLLNIHAPLAWEGRTYRAQPLADAAEFLEARTFEAATRIAVNSVEMANILTGSGVDDRKVVVIPNGVDAALFAPTGADHRNLLPAGALVIGFSGSLKVWHGIDVLLEAFESLSPADARLHLLFVGDGPMRREVQRAADRLPGRVTATGAMAPERVPAWVRTMDVAVSPYPELERFYYSPLKTLEYLAAGRATVSSDIGQLRELIDDGRTGLLVPPGDPRALADAIHRLADDAGLRTRLGAAAADDAALRHRWSDRVSELVAAAVSQSPGRLARGDRRAAARPVRVPARRADAR